MTTPHANDPVFKSIFGKDWDSLPQVMKRHYANRPYTDETGIVEGVMKIESSPLGRLMTPFFRLAGTLVPYEGENIKATVMFTTTAHSDAFHFDRTFHFPRGDYRFHSRMTPVGGNELVEYMRFGIGWRMAYAWTGDKVILSHRGYVWNIFGILLPLPLGLLMGKGYAEETPLDVDTFSMRMEIRHPLWGKIYGYSGLFKITQDA